MKYALSVSVLLHLAFFVLSFVGNEKSGEQKALKQPSGEQIISAEVTEITVAQKIPGQGIKKPKAKFKSKIKCERDSWFGGIGIQEDEVHKVIDVVFSGYPAEKSGLLAGDNILQADNPIRGEPGTVLNLLVFRPSTNTTLTFAIVRDKICYGERKR